MGYESIELQELTRREIRKFVAKPILEIFLDALPIGGDALQIAEVITGRTITGPLAERLTGGKPETQTLGPVARILSALTLAIPFATPVVKKLFAMNQAIKSGGEIYNGRSQINE